MLQKEIEQAFVEWFDTTQYHYVVGRQVRLPFGRLGVLALSYSPGGGVVPIAIEVVLGSVNEKACTRLLGYMAQVDCILTNLVQVHAIHSDEPDVHCSGILVGRSINPLTQRVVEGFGVHFIQYKLEHGALTFQDYMPDIDAMFDFKPRGPLAKTAHAIDLWRTNHRARNTASFQTYEAIVEARGVRDQPLSQTVAYWRRPEDE